MRIVYLHQYFNTPSMSGGTRSFEMARRLVAEGHEVIMITSLRTPTEHNDWFVTKEAGIEVHWLPVQYSNRMSFYERIKAFLKFAFSASARAIKQRGDVIFATSTPLTIAIPAVKAAKKLRIPLVFEVRDLWPELPIAIGAIRNPVLKYAARRLEHWAYFNSEAVVALSPGMRDGVVSSGYDKDRIAVIPNSADNSMFNLSSAAGEEFRSSRDWLGERPLLVYLGTLGVINGVGYLVDLASQLIKLNPEVRVLVVGDGQEKEAIEAKARAAGVYGVNFFMEAPKPKNEMPHILAAADISVGLFVDLPEMRANSSNKFFDTLAAGKPILINYGGWQHDLLVGKQFGIAAWKKDIEVVAQEVIAKIRDRQWLTTAGENSRLVAVEIFDRDKLAMQLQQVLSLAVKRRGAEVSAVTGDIY